MIETGSDWFKNDIHPYYQMKKAHDNSIESLCFNPVNNQELVSSSNDKSIKIWDIQKFKLTSKLMGHTGGVWTTQFSPDGKLILSGSSDKTIMIWDVKSGKIVNQFKENQNKIYSIRLNADGKQLLSCGEGGKIALWDLKKMALSQIIQATIPNEIVYNANFLPGNRFIVSSDSCGMLKIFEAPKYELKAQTILKPRFNEKAFCFETLPQLVDGKIKILAGYQNNALRLWSFDPLLVKFSLDYGIQAHMDSVTSIAFNKGIFTTGSRDGSCRVWEIQRTDGKNKIVANLIGHNQRISQLAFQPGNQNSPQSTLASSSWDQNINLYKV